MKTAHLLLIHKEPLQVERLIRKMNHADFDFYIHLDKKINLKDYLNLKSLPNVFLIENRVDVRWGGYSIVRAIFNSIIEICDQGIDYNFINLLSGQDYPLKSAGILASFFKENAGKEFLSYRDIINDWKEAQRRYEKYHFTDYAFKGSTRLESILNLLLPVRRIPYNLHPYGESMYWMLSPKAALYVVNKVQNDHQMRRFFSLVWGSDEFLFQTIILNSGYKHAVIKNNYRYIDWSENKASPKALKKHDFERLKSSQMLFARKFEWNDDSDLLDMIDSELLSP